MRLRIEHITHYSYSQPVQHAIQALCLTPRTSMHQTVHEWQLTVPGRLFASSDGFGNATHTWTLGRQGLKGLVRAAGVVDTHACPDLLDDERTASPLVYLRPTPLVASHQRLAAFAARHLEAGVNMASLLELAQGVLRQVRYRAGHTDVETTAQEAFDAGSGVCQDQAHVFIAACRSQGVPARYVSGYLHDADAPEPTSHAWADVCIDMARRRWLSIDVTHACLMDERHVRLALGPDYTACAPVRGVRHGGGDEVMDVDVRITPV